MACHQLLLPQDLPPEYLRCSSCHARPYLHHRCLMVCAVGLLGVTVTIFCFSWWCRQLTASPHRLRASVAMYCIASDIVSSMVLRGTAVDALDCHRRGAIFCRDVMLLTLCWPARRLPSSCRAVADQRAGMVPAVHYRRAALVYIFPAR